MKKIIQLSFLLALLASLGGCSEIARRGGWKRGRLSEKEAFLHNLRITCDLTNPSLLDIIRTLEKHNCIVYVSGCFLADESGQECLKMKSPHDFRVNDMKLKNFLMWTRSIVGDSFVIVIREGNIYVLPHVSTGKSSPVENEGASDKKSPNKGVKLTTKTLRVLVPSGLRPSVAAYSKRYVHE